MAALSENDKLDRLAAELGAGDDGPGSGGAVDQNDIDALLAEFQNVAAADAGVATPAADAADDDDAGTGGPMGQDEIDRLFSGGGAADEKVPAPASNAEATGEGESPSVADLTDQEKMDRLIAELQEENRHAAESDDTSGSGNGADPPEESTDTDPETADEYRESQAAAVEDAGSNENGAAATTTLSPEAGPELPDEFDALADDEIDLDGYEDEDAEPVPDPPKGEPETSVETPAAVAVDASANPAGTDSLETSPETSPEIDLETRLARRQARRRAVVLMEKNPTRKWLRWIAAAALLFASAVGGAVVYRAMESGSRETAPDTAATPAGTVAPADASALNADNDPAPAPGGAPGATSALGDGLAERFARIDAARQAMLEKQNEVLQLRREYETGVQEIEALVAGEAMARGIKRYADASAVEAIDYGLRTIQRRLDYIRKLETPVKRLHERSEALLYAKRMAAVNLMLVGLAEGIDSTVIGQRMDTALAANPVEETLQLASAEGKATISLETIWQRIVDRMTNGGPAPSAAAAAAPAVGDDARIWAALCKGDFSDKYQTTSLSPDAASCLSGWQGSELFLNRLSRLEQPEAVALSGWKGQWLAMNRIDTLSAAAATALFQWQGARLSLNGLRQLPDAAAEAVANWPGKELEMMGLERLSLPMARALAHWKRNGGRLFLPEKFYRKQ